jgi:hypothetical protein
LLGLLVAPSWAGFWLGLAAFCGFLAQRPLKITLQDRQRKTHRARTHVAQRFAIAYSLAALVALSATIVSGGWQPLIALLPAVPFAIVFVVYDWRVVRSWQAELAAPTSFAAVVMGIGVAGGLSWSVAVALWVAMIARGVPSVMYIRARLRVAKNKPVTIAPAVIAHVVALAAVTLLVTVNLLPDSAVVAYVILLLRAVGGLSRWHRPIPAKTIGIIEMILGFLTVFLIAVGFYIA